MRDTQVLQRMEYKKSAATITWTDSCVQMHLKDVFKITCAYVTHKCPLSIHHLDMWTRSFRIGWISANTTQQRGKIWLSPNHTHRMKGFE